MNSGNNYETRTAMKVRYILPLIGALLGLLAGCQSPVEPGYTKEADLHKLSVEGAFCSNKDKTFKATIDDEEGLITLKIPYYLSDIDPIQGDLTQMVLTAVMPVGATFEPKLEGVHDLTKDFKSTIHYVDGSSKEYTFRAEYVRSDRSDVTSIKLTNGGDNDKFIYILQPVSEDGSRIIKIVQLGYKHLQLLKHAKLEIETSPWSTLKLPAEGAEMDLTDESTSFTVVSQSGKETKYSFKIVDPNYAPLGKPGVISPLFGVKVIKDGDHGWVDAQNRSMAVIGDELVIANLKGPFLRHNRFTGKATGKTVNRDPIVGDIHGIAHDEAGHLVATTISSIENKWVPNHTLEVWVWKDGIDGTPTKIFTQDLQHDPMFVGKNKNANTGRTMGIAGNVLSGKARIGFVFNGLNEFFVLSLKDGEVVKHSGLIAPKSAIALTNASKCVPTGVEDSDPVVIGALVDRGMVKVGMDGETHYFGPGKRWFTVNGNTKGFAYTHFNGMELVAIGNGSVADWDAGYDWRNRLIVADIKSGAPASLTDGEILDSYNKKYDPAATGDLTAPNEVDYGRLYGWLNEHVGKNPNKVGDACFFVSPDETTVHVYLMVTDMGFMGWEITKYSI